MQDLYDTLHDIVDALFDLDDNDTLSNLVSGVLASAISGISDALSIVADGVTGLIKVFESLAFTIGFVVDSLEKIVTLNFDAVPSNWEEYKKGLSDIWGVKVDGSSGGNSVGNSLPEDIYGPPAPAKPAKPAPTKPVVEKSFIEKLGTNIVKSILTPMGPFFGIRNGISAILKDLGVPGFANGGVVTSPTVALLGEYSGAGKNPEIAAPSSMIKSIVDESNNSVVSTLIQCCRQLITVIDEKDTTTYIGDDEVANAAQRGNRKYYNRTGKPLIAIGV